MAAFISSINTPQTMLCVSFTLRTPKTTIPFYIHSSLTHNSSNSNNNNKINTKPHKKGKLPMNNPSRNQRKKPSYGTSRRSAIKKSFSQEQVMFTGQVSNDPVVGIIGGGMSGLACALYLEKRGIKSTVFDTGLRGLGGRMGTRKIHPEGLIFDHAAQFFTVTDHKFAEMVDDWSRKGMVRQWKGTIGELEAGGRFAPLPTSPPRYIGVNGMRPLADSILSQTSMVDVVRPCWVSALEPYNGKWYLSEKGEPCGQFDAIVIAHNDLALHDFFMVHQMIKLISLRNGKCMIHCLCYHLIPGKCANRLLASSGLPLIARQMKRLDLSSIWALLAAFEDPVPVPSTESAFPFEGAFVKGVDSLSWMANNTKKLLSSQDGGPECWTFLSTATFGKQNKVPQESIPTAAAEKVTEAMLEGVEKALGLQKCSLKKPLYSRVQLWGAALPTNSPGIPCIFDPQGRAGICGDWLLGSSLEAAALSGMALANHIADYFQSGGTCPDEFAIGLHNEFHPLKGHDIGQFPGLAAQGQLDDSHALKLTT